MIPIIRDLSPDQLPNCLFCPDIATKEAFCYQGMTTSRIRCCENPECQKMAKEIALIPMPADTDAPICPNCGTLMQRSGSCHTCPECGQTSGCA